MWLFWVVVEAWGMGTADSGVEEHVRDGGAFVFEVTLLALCLLVDGWLLFSAC